MGYTRVTVLGNTHKADLVLPDDEPLGTLLPQLLQLLQENVPGGQELALSTLSGDRLDLGTSMSEQDVAHGAMLRLTAIDEAPHAPEVTDVTDAVALTRDDLRDRWTPRAAATVSAVAAGILSFIICGLTLPPRITDDLLEGRYQLIGIVVLLGGAVFLARRDQPLPALVFSGATLGAMLPLLQATGKLSPQAMILVAAAIGWLLLGAVLGWGMRRRSALIAAIVGIVVAAVFVTASLLRWDPLILAVSTVLAGLLTLGLLPGLALSFSGLTRYDDQSVQGEHPQRGQVQRAILEGFATLTWTIIAVALPMLLALLILVGTGEQWAMVMATVAGVIVLLRARILPLTPQKVALFITGAAPLLSVLLNHPDLTSMQRAAVLGGVVTILLALSLTRPSAVVAAKLRRAAEILELLLMIAVIPLALAALGIFADLLEVFR
ncbi:MAG: type VII secretion integral membrane protein EccD [Arachnia propionica]|uniref:type VII secretion integral membrane protein EccD n=1 Tax=Arachnia propionica TaxID=1750 RepID=UPI00270010C9|nr:type VII secretion integral membrane protein EccD [Arachnia propionica]